MVTRPAHFPCWEVAFHFLLFNHLFGGYPSTLISRPCLCFRSRCFRKPHIDTFFLFYWCYWVALWNLWKHIIRLSPKNPQNSIVWVIYKCIYLFVYFLFFAKEKSSSQTRLIIHCSTSVVRISNTPQDKRVKSIQQGSQAYGPPPQTQTDLQPSEPEHGPWWAPLPSSSSSSSSSSLFLFPFLLLVMGSEKKEPSSEGTLHMIFERCSNSHTSIHGDITALFCTKGCPERWRGPSVQLQGSLL